MDVSNQLTENLYTLATPVAPFENRPPIIKDKCVARLVVFFCSYMYLFMSYVIVYIHFLLILFLL